MGWDINIVVEVYEDGAWHLSDVEVPADRNYWAFAVLADVCNGYGFAGTDKGDPIVPIDEPRGLPDDLSKELSDLLEAEDGDYIYLGYDSFSWVTLKELLAYDLDADVTMRGYVTNETARNYREKGILPSSWAGWTSLPNHEKLEWKQPLRQAAWLVPEIISTIQPLGDPDRVRIVFGFDY